MTISGGAKTLLDVSLCVFRCGLIRVSRDLNFQPQDLLLFPTGLDQASLSRKTATAAETAAALGPQKSVFSYS